MDFTGCIMKQCGYQSGSGMSGSGMSEVVEVSGQLRLSEGKSMRRTEAGDGFGDSGAVSGWGLECTCSSCWAV